MPKKRWALTVGQVLSWADAHHERTGHWPSQTSGPIVDAPGLTWETVNKALIFGRHGLPGGETLARLLRRERGKPQRHRRRSPDPARQQEAIWLRRQGLTQKEIAQQLGISQQHVSRLLRTEPLRPPPGQKGSGGPPASTG